MNKKIRVLFALCFLPAFFAGPDGLARATDDGSRPDSAETAVLVKTGTLLCRRLLESGHRLREGKWMHESEIYTWYGALRYARAAGDRQLAERLTARFDSLAEQRPRLLPPPTTPERSVAGCLPLLLYRQTGRTGYADLGLPFADSQWELPAVNTLRQRHYAGQGYSWQTQMRLEDIFLIVLLQAEAFRATANPEYADRAARQAVYYIDELQRPGGLFFQTPEVPFYWCRGNGLAAAALAELLKILPAAHPNRAALLNAFTLQAAAWKEFRTYDGVWNHLVDRTDGWPETSGSAWAAYALITGVRSGWLDRSVYGPVAKNAWKALLTYLEPDGGVRETAEETSPRNDRAYYDDRKRPAGDLLGQGPYLWCLCALLENAPYSPWP